MGILTNEIKEFVRKQKLCFVATVCADGSPNLSPKGTTLVWDDEHIVFADIHSPGTVDNLLTNPHLEINMVDVFVRKGYRFKGTAEVHSQGPLFEEVNAFYKKAGATYTIKNIISMRVERVLPLASPVYDTDTAEEDVIARWREYWGSMYPMK